MRARVGASREAVFATLGETVNQLLKLMRQRARESRTNQV